MIVHGLNDWNVKPRNAKKLWQHLQNVPELKLILIRAALSNQLYGVNNHAKQLIPNVTIQDNTQPETWYTYFDLEFNQYFL
ncbi:MAG: Hypothetical protein AJITA_00425 [Acetilactobacillus jinshanensis]